MVYCLLGLVLTDALGLLVFARWGLDSLFLFVVFIYFGFYLV